MLSGCSQDTVRYQSIYCQLPVNIRGKSGKHQAKIRGTSGKVENIRSGNLSFQAIEVLQIRAKKFGFSMVIKLRNSFKKTKKRAIYFRKNSSDAVGPYIGFVLSLLFALWYTRGDEE